MDYLTDEQLTEIICERAASWPGGIAGRWAIDHKSEEQPFHPSYVIEEKYQGGALEAG